MQLFKRKALKKKVDFIIAGTQKGGTSALDKYLREHNQLCMALRKEVHFFDNDDYFLYKPNYKKYHSYFKPNSEDKLVGEATPIYMYWYDSPKRIWKYNPDMKIILILRNPIERAYSQWNMNRMKNKEPLPFWDAIKEEKDRKRKALPKQHRLYSYIDRGFYSEQIKRIWHFFPKSQILIIKNEELKNHPYETLNHIFDFLNVPMIQDIIPKDIHSRPYDSPLTIEEFEYLKNIFFMEIKTLERLLDWNCSEWLNYPNQ